MSDRAFFWLALAAGALGAWWMFVRRPVGAGAPPPLPEILPGPGQALTPYELCVRSGQPADLCRIGASVATTVLKTGADLAVNKLPVGNKVLTKVLNVPPGTKVKVTSAHIGPLKLW